MEDILKLLSLGGPMQSVPVAFPSPFEPRSAGDTILYLNPHGEDVSKSLPTGEIQIGNALAEGCDSIVSDILDTR